MLFRDSDPFQHFSFWWLYTLKAVYFNSKYAVTVTITQGVKYNKIVRVFTERLIVFPQHFCCNFKSTY